MSRTVVCGCGLPSPEGVTSCVVLVVVSVAHSLRGHVQLAEASQRDPRLLDGVHKAMVRRRQHREDQLLRPTRQV